MPSTMDRIIFKIIPDGVKLRSFPGYSPGSILLLRPRKLKPNLTLISIRIISPDHLHTYTEAATIPQEILALPDHPYTTALFHERITTHCRACQQIKERMSFLPPAPPVSPVSPAQV